MNLTLIIFPFFRLVAESAESDGADLRGKKRKIANGKENIPGDETAPAQPGEI